MKKKKESQMMDLDLMEELDYYEKPKKPKKIKSKYIIAFVLVVLAGAGILFSPVFAVKVITAEGNEYFTVGQLAEKISLNEGDNLVLFGGGRAKDILEAEPYIKEAEIKKKLPDTVIISVTERKVRGYVPYMGAYLYIDEEGRVLETQNAVYDALPVVRGLKFENFRLGEILPVENQEELLVVLQMSQMMSKYDLLDIVVEIDVSNTEDIYAYVNNVEIHLGSMEDADQKIRIMAEIIKTIPEEDRGLLELQDLNKPIVFQYLT